MTYEPYNMPDPIRTYKIKIRNVMKKEYLTFTEAARQMGITHQGIYIAVRNGKIKKTLRDGKGKGKKKWMIHQDDLLDYQKRKYSRAYKMYNGQLLFDSKKGRYSIRDVALKYGIPLQRIYYLLRSKNLKASKEGKAWVISQENIDEYQRTRDLSKIKSDEKGI